MSDKPTSLLAQIAALSPEDRAALSRMLNAGQPAATDTRTVKMGPVLDAVPEDQIPTLSKSLNLAAKTATAAEYAEAMRPVVEGFPEVAAVIAANDAYRKKSWPHSARVAVTRLTERRDGIR